MSSTCSTAPRPPCACDAKSPPCARATSSNSSEPCAEANPADHEASHPTPTPGSVTTLVDRLVTRGLVRRVPDLTDQRAVLIEMTTTGRGRTWDAIRHFVGDVARLTASRSPADRAVIADFLIDLVAAVDREARRLHAVDRPG
jgi:hypothetical protein